MTEVCIILFDLSFYFTLTGFYLYIIFEKHPSAWGVPVLICSAGVYMALRNLRFFAGSVGSAGGSGGGGASKAGDAGNAEGAGNTGGTGAGRRGFCGGAAARVLALVCCALPCSILLLSPSLWQAMHFLPAWAFYCFSIWSGRVYTGRSTFEKRFGFTAKLLIVVAPGFFITQRLAAAATGAIPYFIAYLISGVCLMRTLRGGASASGARNAVVMLAALAGSIALAILQAPKLLMAAVRLIWHNVIVKILMYTAYFLSDIIDAIARFFSWLLSLFGAKGVRYELEVDFAAGSLTGEDATVVERATPRWTETAGMVMLALAAAFAIFLVMRRLLGNRAKEKAPMSYAEEREVLAKRDIRHLSGLLRPSDPRQAVRWYYRKYLKEGVSKGAAFARTDTSLSVLRKYCPFFPESGPEELRELYIKARYRNGKGMAKADADAASRIWRGLK